MIKTLTNLFKQDKEKFVVPKGVQDVIPVAAIFDDGIFKVGRINIQKPTALRILTMQWRAVRIRKRCSLNIPNF